MGRLEAYRTYDCLLLWTLYTACFSLSLCTLSLSLSLYIYIHIYTHVLYIYTYTRLYNCMLWYNVCHNCNTNCNCMLWNDDCNAILYHGIPGDITICYIMSCSTSWSCYECSSRAARTQPSQSETSMQSRLRSARNSKTIMSTSGVNTPSPPIKTPFESPWVKLSGRPPIQIYGHENSHPLDLRVCLSQTPRNPNS